MFIEIKLDDSIQLIEAMQKRLNPFNLKPIDLVDSWDTINLQCCLENFLKFHEEFYVFYEHPVHQFKNKLFITHKNQCIEFVKEHINPDEGTGIDVTISSLDMKSMIVCNHDGDIFLAVSDTHSN